MWTRELFLLELQSMFSELSCFFPRYFVGLLCTLNQGLTHLSVQINEQLFLGFTELSYHLVYPDAELMYLAFASERWILSGQTTLSYIDRYV